MGLEKKIKGETRGKNIHQEKGGKTLKTKEKKLRTPYPGQGTES